MLASLCSAPLGLSDARPRQIPSACSETPRTVRDAHLGSPQSLLRHPSLAGRAARRCFQLAVRMRCDGARSDLRTLVWTLPSSVHGSAWTRCSASVYSSSACLAHRVTVSHLAALASVPRAGVCGTGRCRGFHIHQERFAWCLSFPPCAVYLSEHQNLAWCEMEQHNLPGASWLAEVN